MARLVRRFTTPQNKGCDAEVEGVSFDAVKFDSKGLNPRLYEVKTGKYDGFADFLQEQIRDDVFLSLAKEQPVAVKCRLPFTLGIADNGLFTYFQNLATANDPRLVGVDVVHYQACRR
jgi:hypothetical protein